MSGKFPGGFVTAGAPAGYSVAFDGTGDYLTVPSSTPLTLGSGDWTIEFWLYVNALPAAAAIYNLLDQRPTSTNGVYPNIALKDTGAIRFYVNSVEVILSSASAIAINTWYHVALCKSSTSTRLFINGVQSGSTYTDSNNYLGSLLAIAASSFNIGNSPLNGYLSNFRTVKSTALYTTTFTPPTQLFNITNTSLLTCNSPAIIDQSNNAATITTVGDTKVSTFTPFTGYTAGAAGFQPALGAAAPGVWTLDEATNYQATRAWPIYDPYFNLTTLKLGGNIPTNLPTWISDASGNSVVMTINGDTKAASQTPFSISAYPTSGSGYFDGSGDYLNSSITAIGTSNFTIEYWSYLVSHGGTNGEGGYFQISGTAGGLSTTYTVGVLATRSAPGAGSVLNVIVGGTTINTTHVLGLNTWFHTAIVRTSNSVSVYVNGTLVSTPTTVSTNLTGAFLAIGGYYSTAYLCNGYISNFRVTNTAIVPPAGGPTAPLSAVSGTSLLTLQNSQPSANSSFTDSSSNNFAITRAGNTTQGTFTPFSQTGWSNNFNSTSTGFTGSATGGLVSSTTSSFTAECWVYMTQAPTAGTSPAIIGIDCLNGSSTYLSFYVNSSRNVGILWFDSATKTCTGNTVIALNTWSHIAVSVNANAIQLYVDGVAQTLTGTTTLTNRGGTTNAFTIALQTYTTAYQFYGYLSNVRVVSGASLYNSAFTPSTSALGIAGSGTTTLLTCQSNRFVDNSSSPKTLTLSGTPSVQSFSPFAPTAAYSTTTVGGSGYFNGSTDWLTWSGSSVTTAFTFECWFYYTGTFASIAAFVGPGSAVTNALNLYVNNSTSLAIDWYGTSAQAFTVPTMSANQWYHVAFVRNSSNQATVFLNGVRSSTGAVSITTSFANIGAIGYVSSAVPRYWSGYLSGIKYSQSAVYDPTQTTITIPTAPPNPTGSTLCMTFSNAAIVDSTGKNDLVTLGNASISTVQSKYGGSSMYFDGTGDWLSMRMTENLVLRSDFVVEAWVYPTTITGSSRTILFLENGANGATFFVSATGILNLDIAGVATYTLGSTAVVINSWQHVAFVRIGTTLTGYINGVSSGTATVSASLGSTGVCLVGANSNAGGAPFFGYIQDLRITKGYARYISTFTPPTSQLQDQ